MSPRVPVHLMTTSITPYVFKRKPVLPLGVATRPKASDGLRISFIEQLVENVKSDEQVRGNSEVMLGFLESSEFVDDWKGREILPLIGDSLTFVSVVNDAA